MLLPAFQMLAAFAKCPWTEFAQEQQAVAWSFVLEMPLGPNLVWVEIHLVVDSLYFAVLELLVVAVESQLSFVGAFPEALSL